MEKDTTVTKHNTMEGIKVGTEWNGTNWGTRLLRIA